MDGNDQAFPCGAPVYEVSGGLGGPVEARIVTGGLTKRELFAAMAMVGYRANPEHGTSDCSEVARDSIEDADALIAALNKPDGGA